MSATTFTNDVVITGQLAPKSLTIPAGTVTDAGIAAAAGVQASKLQHRFLKDYSNAHSANSRPAPSCC
jgi:hypothetical protein